MPNWNFKNSKQFIASLIMLCNSVLANDKLNNQALNYITSPPPQSNSVSDSGDPNSVVTLDFSVQAAESWDTRGQANNVVENCINGTSITGFKWTDVRIETVGQSFFSEATMHFTNSSGSGGAKVFVGFGNESTGVAFFSSNGIFDLTDNFVSDVTSNSDQKFIIEFYESVDDASNSVDARYTSGTIDVHGLNLTAVEGCPFISTQAANADLQITAEATSTATHIGEEVNYLVNILNNGQDEANNVLLEYTLPRQLEYLSSNCSDGRSGVLSNDQLRVNMLNIVPSSSVTCQINTRAVGYGQYNSTFNISADNDADTNNNSFLLGALGIAYVIPVNNWLALMLLIFSVIFVSKKRFAKQ